MRYGLSFDRKVTIYEGERYVANKCIVTYKDIFYNKIISTFYQILKSAL